MRSLQILLSNVESSGTINSLLENGMGFKEIAQLTEYAVANRYISYINGVLILSDAGRAKLTELRTDVKKLSKDEWIAPEEKSRISQIDMDFIYLPKQDDIP